MAEEKKKKKIDYSRAWVEAKRLIWSYRRRLLLGLQIFAVNRNFAFYGLNKIQYQTQNR